jgi:hypothetical protein
MIHRNQERQPRPAKTRRVASRIAETGTQAGRATYEASVIHRALERAGANPQLKGHLHEVLVQDRMNLREALRGGAARTTLTRSTTAPTVDIVKQQGGKVVQRLQLKDTVSPGAISKLTRQVASGKYRSVQLVGTEETTRAANRALQNAGLSKRMSSSGISSHTTSSLAQRAGAAGSGTLGAATLRAAHAGGAAGAAVGAAVELVQGVSDLVQGRRDAGSVALTVAKAGAKGYASGAAASAAATAGGAAVASGLAAAGASAGVAAAATVAAPVLLAVGVGWAVSSVWDALFE